VPFGENKKSTWEEALDLAYDLARRKLEGLSPQEVAQKALVNWYPQQGIFEVPFFGRILKVFYPQGEVYEGEKRSSRLREVLVLHYLIQAKGSPPRGLWIDFRKLPGGMVYYPVFKNRIIEPFLKAFGEKIDLLREKAEKVGLKRVKMGDFALILQAFPRVELVFGMWEGKEGFRNEGFVLFDPSITDYLSTEDAIWTCHEALSFLRTL